MVGSIFFGLVNCFLRAFFFCFLFFFLKMVNDVVRGPGVILLDKLTKINYLYIYTSIYLFIFFIVLGGGERQAKPSKAKEWLCP